MKIAIIGGGAAGMMAAMSASNANPEAQITLIERNDKLGRKLVITGGGRCNLTTGTTDVRELMKNYPRGNRWLKFAMYEFGPRECYKFFESHGVKLKMEGNRVFPKSEKGEDIVSMFLRNIKINKVKILYKKLVQNIEKDGNSFKIIFNDKATLNADKIILTTGGSAYSKTGSTGDGYKFAKNLGHNITKCVPTLTSFVSKDSFIPKLAGVTIKEAEIKIFIQKTHEIKGPLLVTHNGVSGPAVFALSALSAHEKISKNSYLSIDFIPKINEQKIRTILTEDPNKKIIQIVSKFVPKSIAKIFIDYPNKKVAEVGKKEIFKIIDSLKNFKINIFKRTPGREIVTAGGVDLNEVDKKTMESLITPGLYFAGELLDTDGFTGGYNLQIAWATGKLAGENASKPIDTSN